MLINKDVHPADTIYYIACCILEELKEIKMVKVDDGYRIIKQIYNPILKYSDYILALNFLFLIERISLNEGNLNYVY
ncbi:hypothetical protein SAMN05428981_104222 [Bacillus sp. OV194]|nr:hypothetical protein SAMN05428981_104222 [Bacillus sp. OV194]